MKDYLRIALAQVNLTVGDFRNNYNKILEYIEAARALSADIVVFPELAVTGYPPEDLLLKSGFIRENEKYLQMLAAETKGITAIVGFVETDGDIFNAAAVLNGGRVAAVYRKIYLPNYSVFDENRYFLPGDEPLVFDLAGCRVGVTICEDLWYPDGPARRQVLEGKAEVIVNLSASPYHKRKWQDRERLFAGRASDYHAIIAYVNLIGGQDELVFDGGSLIVDQNGNTLAQGELFHEDFLVRDLDIEAVFRERLRDPRLRSDITRLRAGGGKSKVKFVELEDKGNIGGRKPLLPVKPHSPAAVRDVQGGLSEDAEIYEALVLGTKDYVRKNEFGKVIIGLSGGVDSALTATIAVDALGKDSVHAVFMPSRYTSVESRRDATALAEALGIRLEEIPIEGTFAEYKRMMAGSFKGREEDVTEENIQARIRGNILMALSNKFGWLVLSTGNKSESSVGYATLYGDMAGGFSVLKDVYKTTVNRLARYRNTVEPVIPKNILRKPPTAELKPDQTDMDALPPYDLLDAILEEIIERDIGLDHLVSRGFDRETAEDVFRMVNKNEYKRRQAPPGIRISKRAFGKDRRIPLTNRFNQ